MKVATLIAKTPDGWVTLEAGEDVMAIRGLFKKAKLLDSLPVEDSFATMLLYFDTGGDFRRKRFATPTDAAAEKEAREKARALAEQHRAQLAAEAARAEGQAKAAAVAGKVVEVIKTEIAASVAIDSAVTITQEVNAAQPVATESAPPPPVEPAPAATVAEPAAPSEPTEENHFGDKPPKGGRRR